jgi:hypothetical protein
MSRKYKVLFGFLKIKVREPTLRVRGGDEGKRR